MNGFLSKYGFYYPSTLLKGELVAFYLPLYRRFQYVSNDALLQSQETAFRSLISYCVNKNEFYKDLYANSACDSLSNLASLPTISKSDLIEFGDRISSSRGWLTSAKTTGGSTGEPVKLYKTSDALARERAATWRAYEWAGISIGDPQARFWGVPHSMSSRLKAQLIDVVSNRLRVSAFDLCEESFFRYYERIRRFKPVYLYGYVSVIREFSKYCSANNYNLPTIKSVITTSEILTDSAREDIQSAFNVRVFNEYGCGEVGSIAHECEHGSMHIMADNLIVEIDAPEGGVGEVVVTDLYNRATPLIRYRLGDYATLRGSNCPCGRTLPILGHIHGRAYDLIRSPGGRKIHPESLIYVFEELQSRTLAFKQFQAVQTALDKIVIKIVPSANFSDSIAQMIVDNLKQSVDQYIDYKVEICSDLQRERSGKMRLVKGLPPI